MLHKTRAIVLHHIRYRDTSIIAKCYTEAFGVQSYMVNGIRTAASAGGKSKSAISMAYFQPLSAIDMVVYHKPGQPINRISTIAFADVDALQSQNIVKGTMRLFMAEMLLKVLREEEPDQDLFAFLFSALSAFELADSGYENFHLQFLLKLSTYLGFGLGGSFGTAGYRIGLEQQNGLLSGAVQAINHGQSLPSANKDDLLQMPFFAHLPMSGHQRSHLLYELLAYYRQHLPEFGTLRSLDVLQAVFA